MATVRTSSDDGASLETVVGAEIAIRGRIDGQEDLRVEGRIEGAITLTETLYVEPNGVVIAQVDARDVVVSGILLGDVNATNSVTLEKGAKLVGNIRAPRLIIADGAAFRGDVAMGDDPAPTRERSRATSTVSRSTISRTRSARPSAPPARSAAPSSRPSSRPKSAPGSAPRRRGADDDETTVVIKHAALRKGEAPPEEDEAPKKRRRAKKSARVPARGRRKASKKS